MENELYSERPIIKQFSPFYIQTNHSIVATMAKQKSNITVTSISGFDYGNNGNNNTPPLLLTTESTNAQVNGAKRWSPLVLVFVAAATFVSISAAASSQSNTFKKNGAYNAYNISSTVPTISPSVSSQSSGNDGGGSPSPTSGQNYQSQPSVATPSIESTEHHIQTSQPPSIRNELMATSPSQQPMSNSARNEQVSNPPSKQSTSTPAEADVDNSSSWWQEHWQMFVSADDGEGANPNTEGYPHALLLGIMTLTAAAAGIVVANAKSGRTNEVRPKTAHNLHGGVKKRIDRFSRMITAGSPKKIGSTEDSESSDSDSQSDDSGCYRRAEEAV